MPDKKVDITIATTSDTAGVEQTEKSFEQLDQELGTIVSKLETLQGEFEEAIKAGDAEKAKEKFAQVRVEAEKLRSTMAGIGHESAEGLSELNEQLEIAEQQIEDLADETKKGDKALEKLVDIEKVNQVAEIANSVINIGRGFEELTKRVQESDGTLEDHIATGQQMSQVGVEMGTAMLRASAAFGPVGLAITAVTLAVQAGISVYKEYKKAATAAADAAKKRVDAARENAKAATEEAAAAKAAAKVAEEYKTAVTGRAELEKAWADQLARVNTELGFQEAKLNAQVAAIKKRIAAQSELARAQVEDSFSKKEITQEQRDRRIAFINDQQARNTAGIDQQAGEKKLQLNKNAQVKLQNQLLEAQVHANNLEQMNGALLSPEKRRESDTQLKALRAKLGLASAESVAADNALSEDPENADKKKAAEAKQKAFENAQEALKAPETKALEEALVKDMQFRNMFSSLNEFEAEKAKFAQREKSLKEQIATLKRDADLDRFNLDVSASDEGTRRQISQVREGTRRREAQKRINADKIDKGEERFEEGTEGLVKRLKKANAAAEKNGKTGAQKELDKLIEALNDGATAAELKRAAQTLTQLQKRNSSEVLAAIKKTVSDLQKQQRELEALKRNVGNKLQ